MRLTAPFYWAYDCTYIVIFVIRVLVEEKLLKRPFTLAD